MAVDKGLHILVVDDIDAAVQMLRLQLKQLGFTNIDVARDGAEAVDLINAVKDYGLILADWNMTGVSGLDLLKMVRSNQKLGSVPFIMITGNNQSKDVFAAKQAGVTNYIMKPYNLATLRQRLEAAFGPLG